MGLLDVGGVAEWIQVPGAVTSRRSTVPEMRSLTEKPNGSNETATKLSRVNARTEIKFLIRCGEISTLRSVSGEEEVGMRASPEWETGMVAPLPTMMPGCVERGKEVESIQGRRPCGSWPPCRRTNPHRQSRAAAST